MKVTQPLMSIRLMSNLNTNNFEPLYAVFILSAGLVKTNSTGQLVVTNKSK